MRVRLVVKSNCTDRVSERAFPPNRQQRAPPPQRSRRAAICRREDPAITPTYGRHSRGPTSRSVYEQDQDWNTGRRRRRHLAGYLRLLGYDGLRSLRYVCRRLYACEQGHTRKRHCSQAGGRFTAVGRPRMKSSCAVLNPVPDGQLALDGAYGARLAGNLEFVDAALAKPRFNEQPGRGCQQPLHFT